MYIFLFYFIFFFFTDDIISEWVNFRFYPFQISLNLNHIRHGISWGFKKISSETELRNIRFVYEHVALSVRTKQRRFGQFRFGEFVTGRILLIWTTNIELLQIVIKENCKRSVQE